jgi:KipI family sensor histidine kinase inhibitor
VLPCGDRALLVELDSLAAVRAAYDRWSREAPAGVDELVPAARTVLVRLDPAVLGIGAAETWLRGHPPITDESAVGDGARAAASAQVATPVVIPVVYGGDDLAEVAAAWGCSVEAIVERHSRTTWVCAFIGFAPGFPYLVPVGDALPTVPRRATSRPRVPAGSVALAAEYCGIYPRSSPGGWQLIGSTDAVLWDADRESPALVAPGARVLFEPRRAASTGSAR